MFFILFFICHVNFAPSQKASSLSQIRVLCSTFTMSSFLLEIKKNIQVMKISEIGEILYGSWLKLCTDHPTSLVFLSFLIKFHWGKGIEWTAFYNGFDTPSHVCMYSSQKQNIIFPEMKSETSLSHSPLFLGCEHFLLQHTKTIYNTIFYSSHVLHLLHCLQQFNENKSNSL